MLRSSGKAYLTYDTLLIKESAMSYERYTPSLLERYTFVKCLATFGPLLITLIPDFSIAQPIPVGRNSVTALAAPATLEAAAMESAWTLIFNDEFDQTSVGDLFSSGGLWSSLLLGWNPEGSVGGSYDTRSLEKTRFRLGPSHPGLS
jgi:hypothetical protein